VTSRSVAGVKRNGATSSNGGASRDGTMSVAPLSEGTTSIGEANDGRIVTIGRTIGAATTIVGAEASATITIGMMTGTTIPGSTMTGATSTSTSGSLISTAIAGWVCRSSMTSGRATTH